MADSAVIRWGKNWRDPEEQTGSDMEFNFSIQTRDGTKAVHGFFLHAAGAHVIRIRADRVALSSVVRGVTLIDKEMGVYRVRRVLPVEGGAWMKVICQKVM
ncbi:MAG TPA: hypothetical protein VNQ78_06940 [Paracoccus sp. (in: a-proteobacteria)]|uniref:hypothetical protein n=1 Tax=Paracoccus sp. TaxID=267 RepID=UPI002C634830|nr:hypothetical protein [Paracoccus sp. (in: a-proteobacteria)]HWL56401.1 hypothetical protein [Paracoccus sp. (in: a-proteobacteria)]